MQAAELIDTGCVVLVDVGCRISKAGGRRPNS